MMAVAEHAMKTDYSEALWKSRLRQISSEEKFLLKIFQAQTRFKLYFILWYSGIFSWEMFPNSCPYRWYHKV